VTPRCAPEVAGHIGMVMYSGTERRSRYDRGHTYGRLEHAIERRTRPDACEHTVDAGDSVPRRAEQRPVLLEHRRLAVAQAAEQAGRCFDVGEDEGDRSPGQGHGRYSSSSACGPTAPIDSK